jgi:hypothetical protein
VTLGDTLRAVVTALDAAGIRHMLAGSLASTFHGEPRATQDVDLVIDAEDAESLDRFIALLAVERFYVGDHRAAFARRRSFNVIDRTNGWKVDLIVRRDRPFSRTEFDRRVPATIEGVEVAVATAEDVILSKLEWATLGGSERQLRDVEAVVRAAGGSLDMPYLMKWAERLGVSDALGDVLRHSSSS